MKLKTSSFGKRTDYVIDADPGCVWINGNCFRPHAVRRLAYALLNAAVASDIASPRGRRAKGPRAGRVAPY